MHQILQKMHVTLEDHTKYKYLIDCSGQGFSGRVKILMHTHRLLFLLDRKYWDWLTMDIQPWIHYVPVNEDASDIIDNKVRHPQPRLDSARATKITGHLPDICFRSVCIL